MCFEVAKHIEKILAIFQFWVKHRHENCGWKKSFVFFLFGVLMQQTGVTTKIKVDKHHTKKQKN